MTMSRENRALLVPIAFLALTMLFGLPGVIDRILEEHLTSDLGHQVTWGIGAAAYTFFSGASAGVFMVACLHYVFGFRRFEPLAKMALYTGLACLIAAMLFILADLGRAERAMGVALHANLGSTMAWMMFLYSTYAVIVLAMLALALIPRFSHDPRTLKVLRVLGIIGIPFAICLPAGVGTLFASVRAQPYWNSGALPVAATLSGLSAGGSLLIAMSVFMFDAGEAFRTTIRFLARLVGVVVAFEALITLSEATVIFRSGAPHEAVVLHSIMQGPYAFVFWGGQVLIGAVIPLLILFRKNLGLTGAAFASLAAMIGVFSFRLNLVIPQLTHAGFGKDVIDDPGARYTSEYIPTIGEWSFLLFGLGLAGFLILAGTRLLHLAPRNAAMHFDAALAREHREHRAA